MSWYVYLIESDHDRTIYKGSTHDPVKRLQEHNAGMAKFTATKLPWKMVYIEELPSKKEMLIRERKLKRGNKAYFEFLIISEKNILRRFF